MKKPKKNPIREDRIQNEAIVDAYGPEERAMGWYYYLEGKSRFPFQAQCIAAKTISPLFKGEKAQVRRMAANFSYSRYMRPSSTLLVFVFTLVLGHLSLQAQGQLIAQDVSVPMSVEGDAPIFTLTFKKPDVVYGRPDLFSIPEVGQSSSTRDWQRTSD
jgi:hypothetical protein